MMVMMTMMMMRSTMMKVTTTMMVKMMMFPLIFACNLNQQYNDTRDKLKYAYIDKLKTRSVTLETTSTGVMSVKVVF